LATVEEAHMNEVVALVLVLLLATSGYAAGRMHGQFGYRLGYRFGYRQGYFDGDRASWTRRRREMQAVVASVLSTSDGQGVPLPPGTMGGTMYASAAGEDDGESAEEADEDGSADESELPPPPVSRRGRHATVGS
jgi:hypothetical protein